MASSLKIICSVNIVHLNTYFSNCICFFFSMVTRKKEIFEEAVQHIVFARDKDGFTAKFVGRGKCYFFYLIFII